MAVTARERDRIRGELAKVQGLLPLLMKPRNGHPWTKEDRLALKTHLKRLTAVSPYVMALVLPAAPITLPLLAWWLDRRRAKRQAAPLSR